jgi:cytoskeletal protein CcmA (bactofilin family)
MRKVIPCILALLLLLASVSALQLDESKGDLSIIKEVNENLYVTGDKVVISAPVKGDITGFGDELNINSPVSGSIYAGAGEMNVNAAITGDVMAGGGAVNIKEKVDGDVRLIAFSVEIEGDVTGDVLAKAGEMNLKSKIIEGDIAISANTLTIDSNVKGNINFEGEKLIINGVVEGNVNAKTKKIMIGDKALIKGNLNYTGKKGYIVKEEQVAGTISQDVPKKKWSHKKGWIGKKIFWGLSLLAVGMVLALASPGLVTQLTDGMKENFWKNILYGFLALILAPIAALILIITIIGIPLAVILLLAYALAIFIGVILAAIFLGRLILQKQKTHLLISAILGIVIYAAASKVPVLGGLLKFAATLLGLGAITLALGGLFKKKKGKK